MSFLSPLISATFPSPRPGPHKNLGYAFLSTPALAPWSLKSPTFISNGKPALNLLDIGYAVYYPSAPPKRGWLGGGEGTVHWLSDPKKEVVRGYERFLGKRTYWLLVKAMSFFVPRMRFRANRNAPLLPPSSSSQYPIVVFSHGLAGTRTTYSQYCSALASEGFVVLSIEHKDGSGPLVTVSRGEGDGEKDGLLHYIRGTDLLWAVDEDSSLSHFRTLQLQMRLREVYETYHSFRRVLAGEVEPVFEGMKGDQPLEWLASLRDKVDPEQVYYTGHSFGGATVINTLQTPPPDSAYSRLPVVKAIALDPWLEPLAAPAPSQHGGPVSPPLLVLNSPGFTIWRTHFQRLVKLVKEAKGSLITIMKGTHQSFSDFPLLLPPSSGSLRFLAASHELSINFIRGHLGTSPILKDLQADGGEVEKDEKGKMTATSAVAVHLIGKD
ncbi:putative platelet-activating factor acetylhydrolase 2, cytoplasmic [Dioszegia hungarica]|uniref:Putative phospholipase n=1 Tax=Dioszegia hungarica TaxID=4972 RepID=A0AA38HEV3_9TREE|nr:putative platelet-activating factor acetylhydrolase 2, cytoplasmic [Dioszegia hungarica]KAI9637631.1 putative platelet-activating factor acetylhydrolase 2, cytoplasmic [Dioszegia hungarica]